MEAKKQTVFLTLVLLITLGVAMGVGPLLLKKINPELGDPQLIKTNIDYNVLNHYSDSMVLHKTKEPEKKESIGINQEVSTAQRVKPIKIEDQEKPSNMPEAMDEAFLLLHRNAISGMAEMKNSEARGVSMDDYVESFFPLLDSYRTSSIQLVVSELYTASGIQKYLTLQLLQNIAPIESVRDLVDVFYTEQNTEHQESIIEIFKFTVMDLKSKDSWQEMSAEHDEIKDFFLQNLESFHPSLNQSVNEAIVAIFPLDEVAMLEASGSMPKSVSKPPKEIFYDFVE